MLFKQIPYLLGILLFIATSCKKDNTPQAVDPPPKSDSTLFSNPIVNNGPDPWVAQKGDTYYYTHTMGNRLGIYKTKAVSELGKARSETVWSAPSSGLYSRNIWAPELHYLQGKWYFYFAADDGDDINHRMYVLENSSDDPTEGTWEFKG